MSWNKQNDSSWQEGKACDSKTTIYKEMKRSPELRTTYFVTSQDNIEMPCISTTYILWMRHDLLFFVPHIGPKFHWMTTSLQRTSSRIAVYDSQHSYNPTSKPDSSIVHTHKHLLTSVLYSTVVRAHKLKLHLRMDSIIHFSHYLCRLPPLPLLKMKSST